MSNIQTIISFDFGTKRTGIAIGQALVQSAQPLKSIPTINDLPSIIELNKVIQEWQPNLAVIGKPPSAQKSFTKKLNKLAIFLKEQHQLDSVFVDESLTTEQANFEMYSSKTKTNKKKQLRDSIAARLILETYFEMYCD